MPPPSTPCPSCGRAFFPASLNIHVPQCQAKMAKMVVACPACGLELRQGELNEHMFSYCKVARRQMAPPSPSGGKSHRSNSPQRQQRSITERAGSAGRQRSPRPSRTPRSARSEGKKPREPLPVQEVGADGRVPCGRCGRKFAPDRIAQHQYICVQLRRGPAKPPHEVAERARQLASGLAFSAHITGGRGGGRGGRGGRGRGGATVQRGGGQMRPRRLGPGWREQSYQLQEAIRAARHGRGLRSSSIARGGGFVVDTDFLSNGGGFSGGGGGYGYAKGHGHHRPGSPARLAAGAHTFSSRTPSKPAKLTMAQRSHAAESARLEEQMMASPQRSSRPPMRTTCNGTVIHGGGGGFSGMAAMNGRGGILPGGGGTPGGFDPASNQTSRDNPLYRGY